MFALVVRVRIEQIVNNIRKRGAAVLERKWCRLYHDEYLICASTRNPDDLNSTQCFIQFMIGTTALH